MNLALLTDGLRAEREQGITIDVAYRYFATARRTFILADTPGHVQYTRNMVTGASTANLSIILVDARTGVIEQSRRHTAIASLLRDGELILIDPDGTRTHFGARTARLDVCVTLQVLDEQLYADAAFGGTLGAGEAYIHGLWRCDDLTALAKSG